MYQLVQDFFHQQYYKHGGFNLFEKYAKVTMDPLPRKNGVKIKNISDTSTNQM